MGTYVMGSLILAHLHRQDGQRILSGIWVTIAVAAFLGQVLVFGGRP